MHRVLLTLALTTAIAAPASAQSFDASFSSSSGIRNIVFAEPAPPGYPRGFNFGGRHHRHIHVGDDAFYGGSGYAGGYYDYGDYDANRSFDPDRWNDWWHDRPDRAYPRWMSRNQGCARPWYSGDVLTC
jgi:hypothetical protein